MVVITCSISTRAKTQISVRKFTGAKTQSMRMLAFLFFSPSWNSVSITWDFFRFSGPFGRAENPSLRIPGYDFQPRLNCTPGLNPSPCNRQFSFRRICFRSRSEISARMKFPMQSGPYSVNLSITNIIFKWYYDFTSENLWCEMRLRWLLHAWRISFRAEIL